MARRPNRRCVTPKFFSVWDIPDSEPANAVGLSEERIHGSLDDLNDESSAYPARTRRPVASSDDNLQGLQHCRVGCVDYIIVAWKTRSIHYQDKSWPVTTLAK